MRKTLLLAGAVLLAGCGSSTRSVASTAAAPTTVKGSATVPTGALPTVTGEAGKAPTVVIPKSAAPAALSSTVITAGTGALVNAGDDLTAHYVGQIWDTGTVFDSSWTRGQPATFGIGVGQVIAGWDEGLVGQKIGSRILLTIPPDKGYGTAGRPPKIKGTDTLVFVVDIVDSKAGKPVPTTASVAPGDKVVVTGDAGKQPSIALPKSAAPATLEKTVIIPGTGAEVKAGQQIKVQYLGVVWATGKQFDASWDRGEPIEFGIGTKQVIAGWDEGLVGQKIGSRVLLTIPPDKGYGAAGQPSAGIKGTDTLVFVVDILDSK